MKKFLGKVLMTVFAAGGIFGYRYYNHNYKGEKAYAKVPNQIPEKQKAVDTAGNVIEGIYEYRYNLAFSDIEGNIQKIGYAVTGEDPQPLEPDSYIAAHISSISVTSKPHMIAENKIPAKALANLK